VGRFQVRQRTRTGSDDVEYVVEDSEDRHRPVAEFADRGQADAHAEKLNAGPLDWDEQEAWQDEWDEEDDAW
jgi:hypothetical protein